MVKLLSTASAYISRSTCIYENLAFEEWLFRHHNLAEMGEMMLIWRYSDFLISLISCSFSNTPSVVIGRHQNPWLEIDVNYARDKEINLVRRFSGGGTVYHDLGK